MAKQFLLVDAHNVIFARPDLAACHRRSPATAREELQHELQTRLLEGMSKELALREHGLLESVQQSLEAMLHKALPAESTAIADDIAGHYQTHIEPKQFKGMVVVYDRDAVVMMYYLLAARLGKDAVEAVMNISQGTIENEMDENGKPRKISPDWLK